LGLVFLFGGEVCRCLDFAPRGFSNPRWFRLRMPCYTIPLCTSGLLAGSMLVEWSELMAVTLGQGGQAKASAGLGKARLSM